MHSVYNQAQLMMQFYDCSPSSLFYTAVRPGTSTVLINKHWELLERWSLSSRHESKTISACTVCSFTSLLPEVYGLAAYQIIFFIWMQLHGMCRYKVDYIFLLCKNYAITIKLTIIKALHAFCPPLSHLNMLRTPINAKSMFVSEPKVENGTCLNTDPV